MRGDRLGHVVNFKNGVGIIVSTNGNLRCDFEREVCDLEPRRGSLVRFTAVMAKGRHKRMIASAVEVLNNQ
jgi:hypothetical protein